jgi:hypothetical protein
LLFPVQSGVSCRNINRAAYVIALNVLVRHSQTSKLPCAATLLMLSRRIFRELTDSLLLGTKYGSGAVTSITQCWTCRFPSSAISNGVRNSSSSSSTRWKSRQGKDFFAREARVQGLKSRAAFKLLEVRLKHLFIVQWLILVAQRETQALQAWPDRC